MAKQTPFKKTQKNDPGFPLTKHRGSGQWCKKLPRRHGGRTIYFGPIEDPDAALGKYLDEWPEWQAGRNPREKLSGVTLETLCNQFLEEKAGKVTTGEMTPRTHSDYTRTCQTLCDHVGKTRSAESLTDETFKSIRVRFATKEDGKLIRQFRIRAILGLWPDGGKRAPDLSKVPADRRTWLESQCNPSQYEKWLKNQQAPATVA
jgi:hypothetical protein